MLVVNGTTSHSISPLMAVSYVERDDDNWTPTLCWRIGVGLHKPDFTAEGLFPRRRQLVSFLPRELGECELAPQGVLIDFAVTESGVVV